MFCCLNSEASQMKTIQGKVQGKWVEIVTIIPEDDEVGIPLTNQPMYPLHNKLPGLMLEPLYHHSLDNLVWLKSPALQHFLEGAEHMEGTWWHIQVVWRMV
jgi:hypothetical protein